MQALIKNTRWLKIIVWVFVLLGALYIISLLPVFNRLSRFNIFVPRSVESMYWTWLTAIVFGQLIFNKELHIRYRIALGLLLIAIFATGLSASRREWTSGWLPPLIAVGVILWLRSWRAGLAATLFSIAVLAISKSSFINEFVFSSNQYSIYSRFATYPILFKLIQANPIIGLGFANYSHYTSLFPILGWYVSFNSHNNYMDIIAQTGFIGLLIFFGLVIAIGLRGWNLRKQKVDGFSSGYINACLGGLVGMLLSGMFGDWFLPYLYNIGIPGFRSSVFAWIFLGGLLALGRIIEKQQQQDYSVQTPNQSS
jgi:O-antigen ligase